MISITSNLTTGENLAVKRQKELEKQQKIAFEGRRADRNIVAELAKEKGEALNSPKERQIAEALGRLGQDGHRDNVQFLLDVAENLKYGIKKGSMMERYLSSESAIADKEVKQNVNWEKLLQTALEGALSKCSAPDKPAFEERFNKLFPAASQKQELTSPNMTWLSVNPNVKLEKEAIKYSEQILNSAELAKCEDKKAVDQIKKHLGYFMASSETHITEKAEILKLLVWFISDEYKITPQLQDRKVQALAEMINDVVVREPGNPVYTAKDMLQKHGSCVSISSGRKAMAHEHKLAYVTNVLSEIDDKPTMQIFDVTDPKNEEKITVEKAKIDWNAAMAENYRIVDTAVLNWMHIADNMGNGLTKAGQFISFDVERYGMFRDAHLDLDMSPEHQPKFDLLRATWKVKKAVKSYQENLYGIKEGKDQVKKHDLEVPLFSSVAIKQVEEIIAGLAQESKQTLTDQQIHTLASNLVDQTKIKDQVRMLEDKAIALQKSGNSAEAQKVNAEKAALEEIVIDPVEGPKTKSAKLAKQIKALLPDVADEKINLVMPKILNHFKFMEDILVKDKDVKDKLMPSGEYGANGIKRQLFTIAAYNRVRTEAEVKIPEKLQEMAQKLNVPAEEAAVLKKLEDTGVILPRTKLDAMYAEFEKLDRYKEKDIKKGQEGYISKKELYEPFAQFKDDFKAIEKTVNAIRRDVIRDEKDLNKELDQQLDEVYKKRGRALGRFWTHQQGSSGLSTQQGARILKQQSGEDVYVEHDVQKALDYIMSGKGVTQSMTNVEHYEFSGHAQYVDDCKEENILNPKTGEVEKQRVMYHDNTWGHKELRHIWTDDGGHKRTDYGSKRGGPNGYLLGDGLTNGTPEIELIAGKGVHKPDKVNDTRAKKFDSAIGMEYPMFMEAIQEGPILSANEKANSLVNLILNAAGPQTQQRVDSYMGKLLMGNVPKIEAIAAELSQDLCRTAFDVIDSGNLGGLKEALDSRVIYVMNKTNNKLFAPDGQKELKAKLGQNIAEYVEKVMKDDNVPANMKKVQVAGIVEYITTQSIYNTTKPGQSVNIKSNENFDKQVDKTYEDLVKIIKGTGELIPGLDPENVKTAGIRTREQFNAIPENHLLKMLLNKMTMIDFAQDNEAYYAVDKAKTPEDLQKAKQLLVEKHKNQIRTFFNKTPYSLGMVREAFLKVAEEELAAIAQTENVDLKAILEDLTILTENAPKTSNGSASAFEESVNGAITRATDRFIEQTKGQLPEVEAKLKARLTEVFKQTMDENIRINSMKEQSDTFLGKNITEWIDKRFNPRSDKQFLEIVNRLQNMKAEPFEKLLSASTAEEMGIKFKDAFSIIQRIQGLNEKAEESFKQAVRGYVFNQTFQQQVQKDVAEIVKEHHEWLKTDEAKKLSPEEREKVLQEKLNTYYKEKVDLASMYRSLSVELSYVTLDEYVRKNKQQVLDKYGARAALPSIRVASDEQLAEGVKTVLDKIEGVIQQFSQMKNAEKQGRAKLEELQALSVKSEQEQEAKAAMIQQVEMALAQIKEQAEAAKDQIKINFQVFTKAMIRPRHQDDMMHKLNEWAKAVSKEPGSAVANEMKKEIIEQGTKDHMLVHADEFIDHVTKTVPQMVFAKDKISIINQQVFNLWKDGIEKCLRASQKSLLEYKIGTNLAKGKMPQIAKQFRDPSVKMLQNSKTGDGFNFESKKGIQFLLSALQDPTNKNSTLKYFIEQTGLTKTVINSFLEGPSPEATLKRIKMLVNKLNEINTDQEFIQDVFEQYIESLVGSLEKQGIKKLSLEQLEFVMKNYEEVLTKAFEEKGQKDSSTLRGYISVLNENLMVAKQTKAPLPDGDALNLLLEWQEALLQNQDAYTEDVIEKCIAHMNILQARSNGLKMLDDLVPSYDELKPKVNEYQIRLADAIKQIDSVRDSLQQPILDKIVKAKEAEKAEGKDIQEQVQNMSEEELTQMFLQQAQAQINTLAMYINQNQSVAVQGMMQQMLQDQNPLLDQIIVNVFAQTDHPGLKSAMASLMANKGYIDPLAEYLETAVTKDGKFDRSKNIEKDEALIVALYGIINGTMTPDQNYNKKMTDKLVKVFNAICEPEKGTDLMDQMFNTILNLLVNKGNAIQSMLIKDVILNKDPSIHVNTKCVALDALGRYDTMAFYPIFENAVFNVNEITEDASQQINVMNVGMKSLFSFANRYPQMFDYAKLLDQIKAINIDQMANNAKKAGADEVSIASSVKDFKERIDIFEKFLAEQQEKQTKEAKAAA